MCAAVTILVQVSIERRSLLVAVSLNAQRSEVVACFNPLLGMRYMCGGRMDRST